MSWRKINLIEQKMLFISDWLKDEFSFKDLCNRYQVSRKTGYALVNRYNLEGADAFQQKSRIRHYHPNAITDEIKSIVIATKQRYPNWGPVKLRDWLEINYPDGSWPASSTIGDCLKKHGLVKLRHKRRRVPAHSAPLVHCNAVNQVWSADFKGQFRLGNKGNYCYPLTISDNFSRYLLACHGLLSPNTEEAILLFEKIFYEYGLPYAIRTDNGQPFAGLGIGGLTRLSIWWLKLGIIPERIEPGCPEQNGRHERMHRTLKDSTAKPSKENFKDQQKCFDDFKEEYNHQRSHQALDGKRPGDVYARSLRFMPNKLEEIYYPDNFEVRKVRTNGQIKCFGKKYFISELLRREPIGLEMIDEKKAIIYFSKAKLGMIDAKEDKIIRS